MKKLLIFIFFPLFSFAQTDSVKVSFSEEKVEQFEKTTLLDEYDKAFGGNRIVKSAVRLNLQSGIDEKPILSLQFEAKIQNDKSITIWCGQGIASSSPNLNIGLESRWFYEMKNRVKRKIQNANLTGNYLSLRAVYSPYSEPNYYKNGGGYTYNMIEPNAAFSVNWGKQFGNNLDFGLSAGVKQGKETYINSRGDLVNNDSSPTSHTWFVSTTSRMGLGLYFPHKKQLPNNYCEFLHCNYEVKKLLKVNINNAIYADKYNQSIRGDISYEHKIASSAFSINSNLVLSFTNKRNFQQIGRRDSVTKKDNGFSILQIPVFSSLKQNTSIFTLEIHEQVRYYIYMKQRISKGKSANNLNGIYTGLHFSYRNNIGSLAPENFYYSPKTTLGITYGYQTQTNKKSFLDIGLVIRKPPISFLPEHSAPLIVDLNLKLGFAK
ncbi:MAG: hypothetical protein ACOVO2_19845 [Emticicia sp.]|uniref:hypothetical protein n=1 Tax=Emticicia sp. TaxID=1930953 RepID=UPI003BA69EA9